jgi:hypothetical protein
MDNISIKFDRFFTGYSSDMKILMDIMKETQTRPLLQDTPGNFDQKSLKSNQSSSALYRPTENCLHKNFSLCSNASNEDSYEKKLLKQLKLRGVPTRNFNDVASLNSELIIIDSDSDSEFRNFVRSGSVQKPQSAGKKNLKKRGVSLKFNLLKIVQRSGGYKSEVCYKSDSEVSLMSAASSRVSGESITARGDKLMARRRSQSFSGFGSNCEYVLGTSLKNMLERRNTEKERKKYPKILVSKPDEMITASTCKH